MDINYDTSVCYNFEKKVIMCHRFIYECFHGEINHKRVVVHINNIKTDNRLDNLQLITRSEN